MCIQALFFKSLYQSYIEVVSYSRSRSSRVQMGSQCFCTLASGLMRTSPSVVMWSAIWLRESMKLLSPLGSYKYCTTQHMPRAIRLSLASRYLQPSSYFRHALLLGFSISPLHTHTLSNFCLLLYLCVSFFLQILTFWTSCPLSLSISVSYCFLFLSLLLSLWTDSVAARYSSLLSDNLSPSTSIFVFLFPSCCISPSLWAAHLIRNILKIALLSWSCNFGCIYFSS